MPYRRFGFRRRRVKRNFQWARFTSNDTATPTAPAFYTEDLLATFKTAFGLSINFPDIVIWRVRLRISVTIRFPATIVNPEAYGVVVGVFVDNPLFTLEGVNTRPYAEKYMMYQYVPYYLGQALGGTQGPAANANGPLVADFDIKARRRLGNLEDSLLLQVGPTGGIASLQGLSYSGSVLLKLGRA